MRKEHSHGRKVLNYIMKRNNAQPGQTQHSMASDLVLHRLSMSYLQILRQLINYADSLDSEQARLVKFVDYPLIGRLSTKGKNKIIYLSTSTASPPLGDYVQVRVSAVLVEKCF